LSSIESTVTPAHAAVPTGAPVATMSSAVRPGALAARRRRRRALLAGLVLASTLLIYAAWSRLSPSGPGESIQLFNVTRRSFPIVLREKGELKAANSIEIRSEVEGRATIIYLIDEGAQAKKGDLLVEMASDDIDDKTREAEIRVATAQAAYEAAAQSLEILKDEHASTIRKAELALRLAELALEKFKEGEVVQQRQDATLALKKAESQLGRYTETLKDSEELYKQKFLTKIELENDRFNKLAADLDHKQAQLAQEVLDKYTIPMATQEKESNVVEARKELERTRKAASAEEAKSTADVAARKSELAIVQDKLTRLRDQKSKTKVYAPTDGLVVYARTGSMFRSETQIEKGVQVFERQALIELPDTRTMKVAIRVHEAQTEHLKRDLPATVEIEGFASRKLSGRVSKIAALADSQNRWLNPNLKEYETEIMLDGEFTDLKPGITARADILIVELSNVLAVPVQSVYVKDSSYVFVDRGGHPEPVKVTPGMASNEYVEIKQGLAERDKVYLAVTDDMKLLLPDEMTELEKVAHRPAKPAATKAPPATKGKKK